MGDESMTRPPTATRYLPAARLALRSLGRLVDAAEARPLVAAEIDVWRRHEQVLATIRDLLERER